MDRQLERGPVSRRQMLGLAGIGGASLLLAACGNITTPVGTGSASGTSGTQLAALGGAAAPTQAWLYLTILTGAMDGKAGYPEYAPASFTVPANAMVNVEIRCFDNGPATVPAAYSKVQGTTGGSMTVLSAVNGDLSQTKGQTLQSVPANNIAHTFTVAALGLNVPVPPLSTVRFSFQTGKAGTQAWQCMASCGTGSTGWSGPMDEAGYMTGTMTVLA